MDVCFTLSTPISEEQWEFILSSFSPSETYLLGGRSPTGKLFKQATIIETAEELPADKELVVLSPKNGRYIQGDKSLSSFKHPIEAIYMFGSDKAHLSDDNFGSRKPDHKVYIPTDSDIEMWSFIAAAIVFWDMRNG